MNQNMRSAPGVDPILESGITVIVVVVLIITSAFWVIAALLMFVYWGFKNGFGKTARHVWESTAPSKTRPTNQTI